MAYQVLARKYRPQRFSEVIGQEHVTRTLQNAITQQRIAHGYIFSGHRGIGKTTIARIVAMALNCRSKDHPVPEPCGVCDSCVEIRNGNSVDVIEIDAATNRGIDEIRELRDAARYRPARDRFKIWILDEAHQITDAAFNALLKTLEEPPAHVVFMMATTQPEDIPQTIRSRCQHFSFRAVQFDEIVSQLRSIAGQEQINAEDGALALLAEIGDGSMRDALSIMDQAIACCGETLTTETVRGLVGAIPSDTLEEMMAAVERGSSQDVLRQVDHLITQGQSPTHFARQMVRFLRNALVAKVAGKDSPVLQISADERERAGRVAEKFAEEDLARFLQIMLQTHNELGYRQEQRFHLELGLLKLVHAQRMIPLEQLLSEVAGEMPARGAGAPAELRSAGQARAPVPTPASRPSPFEADLARRGSPPRPEPPPRSEPKSEAAPGPFGSSPVPRAEATSFAPQMSGVSSAVAVATEEPASLEAIQQAVLSALQSANSRAEVLSVELRGAELLLQVNAPASLVELSISDEAKRTAAAAASRAAGRALRLKVTGTASANGGPKPVAKPVASGPGARSRAAEEPVIKRMQEKFNAHIRTIIDHRERR